MRPNRHHPLDDDSGSRMLQGIVHPDDAPPGYAATAALLATAAQLPAVNEDVAATTVSAMVEVIRSATPASGPRHRRSLIGKLFAGKAALAAMATVALTATGAAAATGTLPGPVQGAVAGAVSHIGLNLPDDHGANAKNHDGTTVAPPVRPSATAPTTGDQATTAARGTQPRGPTAPPPTADRATTAARETPTPVPPPAAPAPTFRATPVRTTTAAAPLRPSRHLRRPRPSPRPTTTAAAAPARAAAAPARATAARARAAADADRARAPVIGTRARFPSPSSPGAR
jgi:hypothetical protein